MDFWQPPCKLQPSERDPKPQVSCNQHSANGCLEHTPVGKEGKAKIDMALPAQQKEIPMQ